MNTEHDEAERLAWTWDGEAKLRAARAQWITGVYRDFAAGKFDRIATVMRAAVPRRELRSIPAPRVVVSPPPPREQVIYDVLTNRFRPQVSQFGPSSVRQAVELGMRFPELGDPHFQPSTGWQAHQHHEALRRKRA